MTPLPASYIFLGSPPVGPIALKALELAKYPPSFATSDTSLSSEELVAIVEEHQAGFILVVGYGKILRKAVLDSVAGQVLNIHPSYLPDYRGPAPVVQAILDGARETGVSVMELDKEMDHGPILAQEKFPLNGRETPEELYQLLINHGVRLFLDVIDPYLDGTLEPTPQNHFESSYSHMIAKEDGRLDFGKEARQLEREIRAYQGWPGSWLELGGKRLIVHQAHLEGGELLLDEVQPEGGKKMSLQAFLAGKRIRPEDFYRDLLNKKTGDEA